MEGFNDIPVFVTVVEKGSFSAAARVLGVSKSAVSKRVGQLENRLGIQLLHRTTRKLALTEAGERYFVHAARALAAVRDGEDEVSQLRGAPQGRLRVNAPMSFGRLHLAPLVPQFLKRHPKIQLELIMDDRICNLVEGGVDIAIRGGRLTDSSLIARKLTSFRSMICVSPDYARAHPKPRHPTELKDQNCLIFSYSSESVHWTFTNDSGTETIEVAGNYRVSNSEALREAVLQGLGVGRLPSFVAARDVEEGRLEQWYADYQMPENAFYAVFLRREYLPAKVKAFLDFAQEHLADSGG